MPPTHVLQPISSQIPGYLSRDIEERGRALDEWQVVFDRIKEILRRAARKVLQDEEEVHKYFMSGEKILRGIERGRGREEERERERERGREGEREIEIF